MSDQIVGHARVNIKVGDLIHITVNADGTWESPEIRFGDESEAPAVEREATTGLVEAELPNAESSDHVEPV